MRALVVLALLIASSACARDVRLGVERRKDLGHGFHRDVIAEKNPPGFFESVGHFEYLFYRDRKLCKLSYECAVAPGGKAIVYQDGPSGLIFLFRPAEGKPVQLTRKFFGIIDEYEWHEREGFIRVVADKYKPTRKERRLAIPPIRPNQAIQRTASKTATNVLCVCHPPVDCVAPCIGLAVADLVSR